jgi:hypothetical protein
LWILNHNFQYNTAVVGSQNEKKRRVITHSVSTNHLLYNYLRSLCRLGAKKRKQGNDNDN